jgi:hypothetical protein
MRKQKGTMERGRGRVWSGEEAAAVANRQCKSSCLLSSAQLSPACLLLLAAVF